MDKYNYITLTIEDEKVRIEKIISYLEEVGSEKDLLDYKERYNNICLYLNAKGKYLNYKKEIDNLKEKLDKLNITKDEYEVDNILLEDTLNMQFNEDTNGKYRNILYENIKLEDYSVQGILYLLFEKESSYSKIVEKRNKLKEILDRNIYPKTYDTLVSQSILIDKEKSVNEEIFVVENDIKSVEDKIDKLSSSVMTTPILKLLYEFWITNSYDSRKVDKNTIFNDNKNFINIKNMIEEEEKEEEISKENNIKEEDNIIPDLNLPGINEDTFVDIDGKDYVKMEDNS